MIETILQNISQFFIVNPFIFSLTVFVAVALWGDGSMIALTILALNLHVHFWVVLIGGYIGATFGDLIWFLVGKRYLPKMEKHKKFGKHYDKIVHHLHRIAGDNLFVMLVIAKLLYGTRVMALFYLAHKKISLKKFLQYNALALLVWLGFIGIIAWLVALGFNKLTNTINNIQIALTALVIFILIWGWIERKINRWIER